MIARWLGMSGLGALGIAVLALLFTVSAAPPPDWTKVVRATPQGGRLVGNPAARVKLVEFAAYTCPHCARLAREGGPTLAGHIRAGRLAIDFRPVVFDQLGLAATIVARCVPPARFLAVNDALYARQDEWHTRAHAYTEANARELSRYPMVDQLQAAAVEGGIGAVAGLNPAQTKACFANDALIAATARDTDAATAAVSGTPTFQLGGQTFSADWATLQTRLRAAGLN